jgi:WD40 repeat protein
MAEIKSRNPYVGPRPFERNTHDQGRFFGRDRETQEIVSLVYGHPVVLVYAQSGAGKTSLFNARITPTLESRGFEVLPTVRVHGALPEGIDPQKTENPFLLNVLLRLEHQADASALEDKSLATYLKERPRSLPATGQIPRKGRPMPRVLIIDQFEELFTQYPACQREWQEAFFDQIAAALEADPLLRCVFVLREDYLAQLDPFAQQLPEELRIRFRLERLQRQAALAAIVGPLRETERSFAENVAEGLVRELLQTRVLSGTGETELVSGEFVEPVQLQVVCRGLWEALPAEVEIITADHVRVFGDVDQALTAFYERSIAETVAETGVAEGELRSWFARTLITPSGTRGTVYRGPEETSGIPNAAVDVLQDLHLIRGEQRAGARWYELTHDRFIGPIQAANRQWLGEQQETEQLRLQLEERAAEWTAADRSKRKAYLLKPVEIQEADRWMAGRDAAGQPYDPTILTLVQASKDKRQRDRLRLLIGAALILLFVAILGTVTGFTLAQSEREKAVRSKETAEAAVTVAVAQERIAKDAADTADAERRNAVAAADTAVAEQTRAASSAGTAVAEQTRADTAASTAVAEKQRADTAAGTAVAEKQRADTAAVTAEAERLRAEQQLRESTSRALAAAAVSNLDIDPELSILLAVEAVSATYANDKAVVSEAENALHQAMLASRIEHTFYLDQEAHSVAFGPDGNQLAVAGSGGSVTLWDTELMTEVLSFTGHTNTVSDIAFFKTWIATASADGTAKVWDVASGQELRTLDGHTQRVWTVDFSPDGSRLVTASNDETARVWDAGSGEESLKVTGHKGAILGAALGGPPDGWRLATAGADSTAREWHSYSGQRRHVLTGHESAVTRVAFSPDGTQLVTASHDNTARLWDLVSGDTKRVYQGHTNAIQDLYYDGTWIATASADRTAKVWEVGSSQALHTLSGHSGWVMGVALSPDRTRLATASLDKTVRLWDLTTRHELRAPVGHGSDWIRYVSFSPDGKRLATASEDKTAKVWNRESGDELYTLRGHEQTVTRAVFAPVEPHLYTASFDGTIKIWDAASGTLLSTLGPPGAQVRGLALSADGSRLVAVRDDGLIQVWDDPAQGGPPTRSIQSGTRSWDVAVTADGVHIATAAEDGTAKLWDTNSGEERFSVGDHNKRVLAVAFSPSGKYLATASEDGLAKLWDVESRQEIHTFFGHTNSVWDVAFSGDGKRLATASFDKTAKVWDVDTGLEQLSLSGHASPVMSVAFSPDGRYLATSGRDGAVQLYALDVEELLKLACSRVTRNLSQHEWEIYMGNRESYQQTCTDGVP